MSTRSTSTYSGRLIIPEGTYDVDELRTTTIVDSKDVETFGVEHITQKVKRDVIDQLAAAMVRSEGKMLEVETEYDVTRMKHIFVVRIKILTRV